MFSVIKKLLGKGETNESKDWLHQSLTTGPVTIDYLPNTGCVTPHAHIPDWLKEQDLSFIETERLSYPQNSPKTPIINPQLMIESQRELIDKIKDSLNLKNDDFKSHVLPMIARAASYMQLLPASQNHHHNGRGGLFHHSLEVGYFCAQIMRSKDFYEFSEELSEKKGYTVSKASIKAQYITSAFITGFLHDIGKPFSDVVVASASSPNEVRWYPLKQSMLDWAIKTDTREIVFTFVQSRHRSHNAPANIACALNAILTSDIQDFLQDEIYTLVHAALLGHDLTNELVKAMLAADQASTVKDRKNRNIQGSLYVSVERYIIDALKRIALTESANIAGAKIWHSNKGTFIVWNMLVEQIKNILTENKLGKISPQEMIDIMVSCGYFIEASDGTPNWKIYPTIIKGAKLNCFKLSTPEILFTGQLPPETPINLLPQSHEPETHLIESIAEVMQQTDFELPLDETDIEQAAKEIQAKGTIDIELKDAIQETEVENQLPTIEPQIVKPINRNIVSEILSTKKINQQKPSETVRKVESFSNAINSKITDKVNQNKDSAFSILAPRSNAALPEAQPPLPQIENTQKIDHSITEYIESINKPQPLTEKQQRRRNLPDAAAALLPPLNPSVQARKPTTKIGIDQLFPTTTQTSKKTPKQDSSSNKTKNTTPKQNQKAKPVIDPSINVLGDYEFPVDLSDGEPIIGLPMSEIPTPPSIDIPPVGDYSNYPEFSSEEYQQEYSHQEIPHHETPIQTNQIVGIDIFDQLIEINKANNIFYKHDGQILIAYPQCFELASLEPVSNFDLLVKDKIASKRLTRLRNHEFIVLMPEVITQTLMSSITPEKIHLDSKLKRENPEYYAIWQKAVTEAKSFSMTEVNDSNQRFFSLTIFTPAQKQLLTPEVQEILEQYGYMKKHAQKKTPMLLSEEKYWH